MKTSITESLVFQSCLLAEDLKFKEHSEKVNLIYDSKAGRIFRFLPDYPYILINLGHKRTLK